MSTDICRYLDDVRAIATAAGEKILDVYRRDFDVTHKEDRSPLTEADRSSHELIVAPGYNHYETGETIGQPYAVLGRAAMDMMGLNKA